MLKDLHYYNLEYTIGKEVENAQEKGPKSDSLPIRKAADRNEDKYNTMIKHSDIEVVTGRVKK